MWTGEMFKENSFETPERKVNPIRPKSRQINVRRFKMTTILEQFNVSVPYFMTPSFQVIYIISEKIRPTYDSLVSLRSCSSRAY